MTLTLSTVVHTMLYTLKLSWRYTHWECPYHDSLLIGLTIAAALYCPLVAVYHSIISKVKQINTNRVLILYINSNEVIHVIIIICKIFLYYKAYSLSCAISDRLEKHKMERINMENEMKMKSSLFFRDMIREVAFSLELPQNKHSASRDGLIKHELSLFISLDRLKELSRGNNVIHLLFSRGFQVWHHVHETLCHTSADHQRAAHPLRCSPLTLRLSFVWDNSRVNNFDGSIRRWVNKRTTGFDQIRIRSDDQNMYAPFIGPLFRNMLEWFPIPK